MSLSTDETLTFSTMYERLQQQADRLASDKATKSWTPINNHPLAITNGSQFQEEDLVDVEDQVEEGLNQMISLEVHFGKVSNQDQLIKRTDTKIVIIILKAQLGAL